MLMVCFLSAQRYNGNRLYLVTIGGEHELYHYMVTIGEEHELYHYLVTIGEEHKLYHIW